MAGGGNSFGPQDALPEDDKLQFWVPLHKLFDGPECIAGLDLRLEFTRGLRNDELAQFHRFLDLNGLQNNWTGEDLEQFPFVIKDAMIAATAAVHNLTVVTRNIRDFDGFKVRTLNPFDPALE